MILIESHARRPLIAAKSFSSLLNSHSIFSSSNSLLGCNLEWLFRSPLLPWERKEKKKRYRAWENRVRKPKEEKTGRENLFQVHSMPSLSFFLSLLRARRRFSRARWTAFVGLVRCFEGVGFTVKGGCTYEALEKYTQDLKIIGSNQAKLTARPAMVAKRNVPFSVSFFFFLFFSHTHARTHARIRSAQVRKRRRRLHGRA